MLFNWRGRVPIKWMLYLSIVFLTGCLNTIDYEQNTINSGAVIQENYYQDPLYYYNNGFDNLYFN